MTTEQRICTERLLQKHHNLIHKVKQHSNSVEHHQHIMRAIYMKSRLWSQQNLDKGHLNVQFLNDGKNLSWSPLDGMERLAHGKLDPLEYEVRHLTPIQAITRVIKERIEPLVGFSYNIIPTPTRERKAHIRINFDSSKGSFSMIGTDAIEKDADLVTINYAWLDVATITHELCHSIGMLHEHQNPFGHTIDWNKPAVYKWAQLTQGWNKQRTDENILDRFNRDQINGSKFDPDSIMLYYYPASLTLDGKGTHMNPRLSPTDMLWITKMYPGGKDPKEFYEHIYNSPFDSDLEKSIQKSKAHYVGHKGIMIWKIIVIIVLSICIILLLMYLFSNVKRNGNNQYEYVKRLGTYPKPAIQSSITSTRQGYLTPR